jgi:hypothetical protein
MKYKNISLALFFGLVIVTSSAVFAEEYNFNFVINEQQTKSSNLADSESPLSNAWRVGLESNLLGNWLKGSSELRYGNFSQGMKSNLFASDKYFFNIDLEGSRGDLSYGFNHFLLGKHFYGDYSYEKYPDKDRTGYRSWVAYDFTPLTLKGSYLKSWSNIENDPDKPRTQDQWYKIDSKFKFVSNPFSSISFAYGMGDRRRFENIAEINNSYLGQLNSVQAKVELAFDHLKLIVGANRFSFKKEKRDYKETKENIFVNANFLPDYLISIRPSFDYSQKTFWSTTSKRVARKSKSALGLILKPSDEKYRFSFTTSYNQDSKNYLSDNLNTLKLLATIDWRASKYMRKFPIDWSLNSQFKQIKGFNNPEYNYSDWGFDLNLHWRFI